MQLLISDANILIDMEEGELLRLMVQLPYKFTIPDILFYEELEADHPNLLAQGMEIMPLKSETLLHASELITRHRRVSRYDCFALALAHREDCPLLTGDKALRIAADSESVPVKGSLWLVTLMVEKGLLTKDGARSAYKKMEDAGRRLPWKEAERLLGSV